MPQQIAVCACLTEQCIAFMTAFSQRKGDSTVGCDLLDAADHGHQTCIGEEAILTALQHKGLKTQLCTCFAAGKHIVFRQAVTLYIGISAADAAVKAVVFAVIGQFDQSTEINLVAELFFLYFHSGTAQRRKGLGILCGQQYFVLGIGQMTFCPQLIDKLCGHRLPPFVK